MSINEGICIMQILFTTWGDIDGDFLNRWINPHAPSPCKDHVHFMSIFGPMPVDQSRTDGTASLGHRCRRGLSGHHRTDGRGLAGRPGGEPGGAGKMVISWASNTEYWWFISSRPQPATQWCLSVYKPYKYRSGPVITTSTSDRNPERWWWMDSGNHPLLWPNYSG